jgi:hypothetical protein
MAGMGFFRVDFFALLDFSLLDFAIACSSELSGVAPKFNR